MAAEPYPGRPDALNDLLRVRDLSWAAGTTKILDRVSFDVRPGEFIALTGRNGAGKSTLVDLIAGLRRPAHGSIIVDGHPLDSWQASERARLIAHLPQSVRVDLSFSAGQLVLMGRYPHADSWFESDADRAAVESAMLRTGCREFATRRVSTLSGGERQRVLLAACLAQQPRLLLLDEPSTFLDIDQQLHCFSILRDEATRGTACIAVTHELNLALTFCSRVVVLADHGVAFDKSTTDAIATADWLRLFSDRLVLGTNSSGGAWVSFA